MRNIKRISPFAAKYGSDRYARMLFNLYLYARENVIYCIHFFLYIRYRNNFLLQTQKRVLTGGEIYLLMNILFIISGRLSINSLYSHQNALYTKTTEGVGFYE